MLSGLDGADIQYCDTTDLGLYIRYLCQRLWGKDPKASLNHPVDHMRLRPFLGGRGMLHCEPLSGSANKNVIQFFPRALRCCAWRLNITRLASSPLCTSFQASSPSTKSAKC